MNSNRINGRVSTIMMAKANDHEEKDFNIESNDEYKKKDEDNYIDQEFRKEENGG
jgi:hypothetical protein